MIIGVLSDTHGELHPGVVPLFREARVEMILHAGDVGRYEVIEQIENLAPVKAVKGNVDRSGRVSSLPESISLDLSGAHIFLTHIGGKPGDWSKRLSRPWPTVAICGHSHAPLVETLEGTLFLNPGAAGTHRRFSLPLCAALLTVDAEAGVSARLVHLDAASD